MNNSRVLLTFWRERERERAFPVRPESIHGADRQLAGTLFIKADRRSATLCELGKFLIGNLSDELGGFQLKADDWRRLQLEIKDLASQAYRDRMFYVTRPNSTSSISELNQRIQSIHNHCTLSSLLELLFLTLRGSATSETIRAN